MTDLRAEADEFSAILNLVATRNLLEPREATHALLASLDGPFGDLGPVVDEADLCFVEGDNALDSYRHFAVEARRLTSGMVNPPDLGRAVDQHRAFVDRARLALSVEPQDVEAVDLAFGFDLDYPGNHDEVVAEALGAAGLFGPLGEGPASRVIDFAPTLTLALDDACRLQCRIVVETRSTAMQVRSGQPADGPISVYCTIRQHWGDDLGTGFAESVDRLAEIGARIVEGRVLPRVVRPIARAIARRS